MNGCWGQYELMMKRGDKIVDFSSKKAGESGVTNKKNIRKGLEAKGQGNKENEGKVDLK